MAVSPGGSLGGQDWSQTTAERAASSEIPGCFNIHGQVNVRSYPNCSQVGLPSGSLVDGAYSKTKAKHGNSQIQRDGAVTRTTAAEPATGCDPAFSKWPCSVLDSTSAL